MDKEKQGNYLTELESLKEVFESKGFVVHLGQIDINGSMAQCDIEVKSVSDSLTARITGYKIPIESKRKILKVLNMHLNCLEAMYLQYVANKRSSFKREFKVESFYIQTIRIHAYIVRIFGKYSDIATRFYEVTQKATKENWGAAVGVIKGLILAVDDDSH